MPVAVNPRRGGKDVDKPTVTVRPNGPYLVKGAMKLVDPEGKEFHLAGDTVALCRCGHSANKPFCDGTHNRVGFQSVEHAR
jgi:CDGSH-type Zn-finger protein